MKFFEKIKIRLKNGKSRQIRLCNIPILQYDVIENEKKKYYCPLLEKTNIDKEKTVAYLKVNSNANYSFLCLQHWVDIMEALNIKIYIICDKENIIREIYNRICFKNAQFEIIKSYIKPLKEITKTIATTGWTKATYAHMSTFYHAKMNGIKSFWNIDADDTIFLAETLDVAKFLNNVKDYADTNKIAAFSLDIWHSRTRGQHWSFGITYTRTDIDWMNVFVQNKDNSWWNYYKDVEVAFNLDWFFTYLKNYKNYKIETFYPHNMKFIHWGGGDFLMNTIGANIYEWDNDKLKFPIISSIFKNEELAYADIPSGCVKFETNLTEKDYIDFMFKRLSFLRFFPKPWLKLHDLTEFFHKYLADVYDFDK